MIRNPRLILGDCRTVDADYRAVGIAKVEHPALTSNLILNYDPSNDGTFSGLDQFGQGRENGSGINTPVCPP